LYTGKVRSYLIKKGIEFRELTPAHPDFKQRILPAVGVFVVPVLETPEGELIEFPDTPEVWLADDAIPPTLEPVIALLFGDWGPMLSADTAAFNAWLASRSERPTGTPANLDNQKMVHPSVGLVDYTWRGCKVSRASAPHGLWMFAKAQQAAVEANGEASGRFTDLLRRTGGGSVMALRPARRMGRANYTLVLL
jgi:hypothetical protein